MPDRDYYLEHRSRKPAYQPMSPMLALEGGLEEERRAVALETKIAEAS